MIASRTTILLLLLTCVGCEGLFGADFDDVSRASDADDGGKISNGDDSGVNSTTSDGGSNGNGGNGNGGNGNGGNGNDGGSGSGGNGNDGGNDGLDGGTVDGSPGDTCAGTCEGALVTGLTGIGTLAVDDTNIYFSTLDAMGEGSIHTCPKSGCVGAPKRLAKGFRFEGGNIGQAPIKGLAYDKHRIFWSGVVKTSGWALYACAKGGCSETPSRLIDGAVGDVVATDDRVIWADVSAVNECPSTTCSTSSAAWVETVGSSTRVSIGAEKNMVAYVGSFATRLVNLETKVKVPLGDGRKESGIAVKDGVAYFTTSESYVVSCPASGCTDPGTNQPKPAVVGSSAKPEFPAVDAKHVYWIDSADKRIYRCALPACTATGPEIFVSDVQVSTRTIGLDQSYVYWATDSGVFRKKK